MAIFTIREFEVILQSLKYYKYENYDKYHSKFLQNASEEIGILIEKIKQQKGV